MMVPFFLFSSELQQWTAEIEQLLTSANQSCQRLLSKNSSSSVAATSSNQDGGRLRDVINIVLEGCGIEGDLQLQIQVQSILV